MGSVNRFGWIGFGLGAVALVVGLVVTVGSAIAAGDWWLAREPWIGAGLTLLVLGLAATAVFALVLDVVEPIGWWRLVAVPPAIVVGLLWILWLVFGLAGSGGAEHDVRTILYSVPQMLVVVLVGTILMALPPLVRAARRRGERRRVRWES